MPKVVFKIPGNVVAAHPELKKWQWEAGDEVEFSSIVDGAPAGVRLEAYSYYGTIWVRAADAGSMVRMRRYSNEIGGEAKPDEGEVAKVLASRNPKKELAVGE